MRLRYLFFGFFAFAGSMSPAATVADLAIVNVIRQADPTLVSEKIVYRNAVSSDLDLVIAIASTAKEPVQSGPDWFYWDENQKLGLFLQQKTDPDRVYSLTFALGSPDCSAHIERATSTDTVISCMPEQGNDSINQKFVYDLRAKRLVSHFAYRPYEMSQAFDGSGRRTVFVGQEVMDQAKRVAVELYPGETPEFRVLDKSEAAPWLSREGQGVRPGDSMNMMDDRGKTHLLPQSTHDELAKARPELIKAVYVSGGLHIEETIGPTQREGNKIWFGKTFYDSEGYSGVGGFGYFDTTDGQYHLFSLPEVADFSISALRVEHDAVWLGLCTRGEYGDGSGGILRYDRETYALRKYNLADIAFSIVVFGDRVIAGTDRGIAVMQADKTTRYFVDRTTNGRLRIAEAIR
jgi:hypothetical protein